MFKWKRSVNERLAELEQCADIDAEYSAEKVAHYDREIRSLGWLFSILWRRAEKVKRTFAEWSPKLQKTEDRVAVLEANVKNLLSLVLDTQKNGKSSGVDELHIEAGDHTYHCFKHEGSWQYVKFPKGQAVGFDREIGAFEI